MNPIGSTLQQRYQILEQLGNIGAVTTYLAVDLQVPGNLQLKCVIHRYELPTAIENEAPWERAELSAQMLSQMSDRIERLPTVYSYFVEAEAFYLVREFIHGVPLDRELVPGKPWTESRLVMLAIDLLEILQDVDSCEVIPNPISLQQILRRNLDRKLVLLNPPIATGVPQYSAVDELSPTQRDLFAVGEIVIAAATGLAGADLPLTAHNRSHWQQKATHIHHPELIAIIERLVMYDLYGSCAVDAPDSLRSLSVSTALQAFVRVMSQLLTHHQTPTNSRIEIAKHVQMLVDRGTVFYETGACQQAIAAYDLALSVDPRCVDAYCGRGNARRYLGDYAGSRVDFDAAISIDAQHGIAYIGRALSNNLRSQVDAGATADFQHGRELLAQPQTAIAYMMRGTAQAQLGDAQAALDDYTTAIGLNPRLGVAYNNRGNLRQHLGDLDGAVEDFSIVLEIDSQSPTAYNNRAIVYTYLGKYPEAIADFDRALAIQPNFTSVYNNRANVYSQIGEYTAAIEDYSYSISFDPNFAVAYSNRANIYRLQGDFTAALADYDRAIALDPHLVLGYYNRGICYRQVGKHQAAIENYTQTLALDPEYFAAYYHRGNARQYLGDKRGAIADYTQTIRFDPNHAHAYYNRAITRHEINDLQGTMDDLSCAIQLNPQFTLAYYHRGLLFAKNGHLQPALVEYQRAIELQPNYLDAYYQRGIVRQMLGDLSGAAADFSHSLKLDPNYAPAYYQRGNINLQCGDRTGAIADYHTAANLYLERGDRKTYEQILPILDRLTGF